MGDVPPNKIQPREYSRGSATGALLYNYDGSVWQGNAPYVNGDGDYRKVNLNMVADDWNANYTFAAVRNSLRSPSAVCRGSFCFIDKIEFVIVYFFY